MYIMITFGRETTFTTIMYLHCAHVRVEAGEDDFPPSCKTIDILQNGVSTQVHIETRVVLNNFSIFILLW